MFSHWEVNGKAVSYSETYSFVVKESADLIPVYVEDTTEGVSLQHSDAWIIGWLIDFFNGLLLAAGILLLLIPLVMLILIMFVKVFIRYFELALLQCVLPVFRLSDG